MKQRSKLFSENAKFLFSETSVTYSTKPMVDFAKSVDSDKVAHYEAASFSQH